MEVFTLFYYDKIINSYPAHYKQKQIAVAIRKKTHGVNEASFTCTDNDPVKNWFTWQHIRVFTRGLSIGLNLDTFSLSTFDTMLNVEMGRISVSVRVNKALAFRRVIVGEEVEQWRDQLTVLNSFH